MRKGKLVKFSDFAFEVNPNPGLFVDIEGLDGSGQTTQVRSITLKFRELGISTFDTKEPTGNIIGGLIRGILKGDHRMLPMDAFQFLFVADRRHHLQSEIIPILKNKHLLITDRYLWSSVAFGSIDLDREWLLSLHKYCFIPDITFFLQVRPRICLRRKKLDKFALEFFEKEKQLKKIWKTYKWLFEQFPRYIITINGEQTTEKVSEEIMSIIKKHPKFKNLKRIS